MVPYLLNGIILPRGLLPGEPHFIMYVKHPFESLVASFHYAALRPHELFSLISLISFEKQIKNVIKDLAVEHLPVPRSIWLISVQPERGPWWPQAAPSSLFQCGKRVRLEGSLLSIGGGNLSQKPAEDSPVGPITQNLVTCPQAKITEGETEAHRHLRQWKSTVSGTQQPCIVPSCL